MTTANAIDGKAGQQSDGDALLIKLATIHDKLLTGPMVQNDLMRAWDKARALIANGQKSDLPRQIFECAIEDIQDDVEELMVLISNIPKRESVEDEISTLRMALEDIEMHSVLPFTGIKWMNYIHEVAGKALSNEKEDQATK